MRVKRNKWDSGPLKPPDGQGNDSDTPEALRRKAQEAAARLMAQRQHEQAMCEEIVINDHPISIRDQLTRRAALVLVEQQTGTNIVVKGRYYPPGIHRAPNNPPLLLHITAAQHVGQDEQSKRIAVSRAAAHMHAILRGQATPMSPVPPYPGNRSPAPPPDMLFHSDGQRPMQAGMPVHPGVAAPQQVYMAGPPSHPNHLMHAPPMPGAPMGMPGPTPHLQQTMPTALPAPGPHQSFQFPMAGAAPYQPPMHAPQHASHTASASMAPQAMPAQPLHPGQPPYQAQPLNHVQHPPHGPNSQPSGPQLPPGQGSLPPPGGASGSRPHSARPQFATSMTPGPSSTSHAAQPGSACVIPITFTGPPGFDIEKQLRGPGNSYLSHIERETGATIELHGQVSGPSGGLQLPLQIRIHHPEPWRLKPAEDLIHSLLQTVRTAAHAAATLGAAQAALQPVPPHQQPAQSLHAPHTAPAAAATPAGAYGHPGPWPESGAVPGHHAAQPAACGPQVPLGRPSATPAQTLFAQSPDAVPSGASSFPQQCQPNSMPPGLYPRGPNASAPAPASAVPAGMHPGGTATAGGAAPTSSGSAASECRPPQEKPPQLAKRKFREFKEAPRNTQSRAAVLPSYYKHLADDAAAGGGPAASDGGNAEEVVYGPHGPEEAPEGPARAGLGAHRPSGGSAAARPGPTPAPHPPVGLLVPYDED